MASEYMGFVNMGVLYMGLENLDGGMYKGIEFHPSGKAPTEWEKKR